MLINSHMYGESESQNPVTRIESLSRNPDLGLSMLWNSVSPSINIGLSPDKNKFSLWQSIAPNISRRKVTMASRITRSDCFSVMG